MAQPMGTASTASPGVIRDYGIVNFVGNAELKEREKIARENKEIQDQVPLSNLLQHMMHLWEAAKDAKWPVDERLAKCIRAKKGKYDPDDLNAIREFV